MIIKLEMIVGINESKNKIKYKKLAHYDEKIIFIPKDSDIKKFEEYFLNKDEDNDVNY